MEMMQNEPLTVTLVAEQWNTVLWLLNEAPAAHRVSSPIIAALMQQLHAQSRRLSTEAMFDGLGNEMPQQRQVDNG